jgi:citrate synthase
MEEIKKGLENVVVLKTKISYIDGIKGVLKYRGIDINELMHHSYEAVSFLLLKGKLPNENELEKFSKKIRNMRIIDPEITKVIEFCNFEMEAMDDLRTTVSYISHCDPDLKHNDFDANIRKAQRLVAKFPTIVATFQRIRDGTNPITPTKDLSHGANFLYMLKGERPSKLEAEIMEKDFIISAEHELNASAFSSRITASTQSDFHSCVISGLGTLKGPLHGGARLAVMKMLEDISSPDEAENYIKNLIANKQKIMGFGHRVYKTIDPRAKIFKELVRRIAEEKGDMKWYDCACNIENTVLSEIVDKKGKPIYVNVDFYTGVAYKYLDIPPLLATAVFAIARISGWSAHILEQYSDNRLIRPRAKYV